MSQLDPAIDRLDDGAEPLLVGDDRHDAGLDLTLQLIDPVGRAPARDQAGERPRPQRLVPLEIRDLVALDVLDLDAELGGGGTAGEAAHRCGDLVEPVDGPPEVLRASRHTDRAQIHRHDLRWLLIQAPS
ncbi:MAG: hypothetical protein E6J03_07935 [Chloroflexi bacterium]|nr:MAG: hypothetical protein E6J03_07935 [Chloroflexota bacterium]